MGSAADRPSLTARDHLTHTVVGFSLSEATPNCSNFDTATTITTTADDSHGPYHQARYVRMSSPTCIRPSREICAIEKCVPEGCEKEVDGQKCVASNPTSWISQCAATFRTRRKRNKKNNRDDTPATSKTESILGIWSGHFGTISRFDQIRQIHKSRHFRHLHT